MDMRTGGAGHAVMTDMVSSLGAKRLLPLLVRESIGMGGGTDSGMGGGAMPVSFVSLARFSSDRTAMTVFSGGGGFTG